MECTLSRLRKEINDIFTDHQTRKDKTFLARAGSTLQGLDNVYVRVDTIQSEDSLDFSLDNMPCRPLPPGWESCTLAITEVRCTATSGLGGLDVYTDGRKSTFLHLLSLRDRRIGFSMQNLRLILYLRYFLLLL